MFCTAAVMAAATPPAAVPDASLPLDLALPKWSNAVSLQVAGGYKDNVLLSPVDPERSGFVRYGVEAFFWHLPRGRTDYSAMVSAEETRYFSSETVDREALAFAQFQWRYQEEGKFRFVFDAQGYHLDEVRDVSDTEVDRQVARLKGGGVNIGPTLRWHPWPWAWVEIQATGSRERFQDRSYDGEIPEGTARIGWRPADRIEFSLAAIDRERRFDRRSQYSLGGLPVPDTLLVISEREKEALLKVSWGENARWTFQTRASLLDFADNGTGYFNYEQRWASQALEWQGERWQVELELTGGRREFENQTVGRGVSPPIRIAEEYAAELHVEREISPRWTAYASYRWERNRSNETIASYRVNEGLLGIRWSWEK